MNIIPFFVVWNPINRSPMMRHKSHNEAKTEALRLASLCTGQEFFVLSVTGCAVEVKPANWVPVSEDISWPGAQIFKGSAP